VLACGHDDGYAPWLGQFVGDKQVAERITLVEGCPFPVKMRNLGLKTTQFSSVFNQVARSAAPRARDTPATVPDISAENISSSKLPKAMGAAISGAIAGQNPRAQSDRLRPVLNSQSGRRIDKPLLVDRAIVDRIKKASLCYYFYLRGQCIMPCRRNHDYRALTDEEFDALWDQARQGKCLRSTKVDRKGGEDCSDVMCVYGHTKDAQMVA
jgi:uracil-DNA glycosylase